MGTCHSEHTFGMIEPSSPGDLTGLTRSKLGEVRVERRSELIEAADALHRRVSSNQRELLRVIAELDLAEAWRGSGAHDMAHWLVMRHGISDWKARRWIAAGHALESLPRISRAFAGGVLGIDKVVELTRFATAETEEGLVTWAAGVSSGCIRHRADLETRREIGEVADVERDRSLSWWYLDDGKRFGLEAELPAAQGAVVAQTLERLANDLPAMPGEDGSACRGARRADALVALCSAPAGSDGDQDRATVVVHASLEALADGDGSCEIENGRSSTPSPRSGCSAEGVCRSSWRTGTVSRSGSGEPLGSPPRG